MIFFIYIVNDVHEQIRQEAHKILDSNDKQIHDLVKILANTKAQRWIKLAFILSMRKQAMDQINNITDNFHWNGELDINASIDAKKLIDMNDYYIVALALIPVSNKGKRSGYVTPNNNLSNELNHEQQSQLLIHELRSKIISLILTFASPINRFQISTRELTKKIPRGRFKFCNNMDNIKYIIDEFEKAKLIKSANPVNKKSKNTKYSKIITRNQLSTLNLNDEEKKNIKKIFNNYGLISSLGDWGLGWGPVETDYMKSIENIPL